jgi:hypothetical protein
MRDDPPRFDARLHRDAPPAETIVLALTIATEVRGHQDLGEYVV